MGRVELSDLDLFLFFFIWDGFFGCLWMAFFKSKHIYKFPYAYSNNIHILKIKLIVS